MEGRKTAIINFPDYLHDKIQGFTNLHGWWKPPEYVISFWANGCIVPYENEEDYHKKKSEIFASHAFATKDFIKFYNFTLLSFQKFDNFSFVGQMCRDKVLQGMKRENATGNAMRMLADLMNAEDLSKYKFLSARVISSKA